MARAQFIKPIPDADLIKMLYSTAVDSTTVEAAFFDEHGILQYPWRAEIEKLAGRERHTVALEGRSWAVPDRKTIAAICILSEFDARVARVAAHDGKSAAMDHYILSEVHHTHLTTTRRVSIDRLAAALSMAARLISMPPSSDSDYDLMLAIEVVFDSLPLLHMPFDGNAFEEIGAECAGIAWGIYEIPATWDPEHVKRALWR